MKQDKGAVLITGASTGIGEACALLLDRSGCQAFAGVRYIKAGETLHAEGSECLLPESRDEETKMSVLDRFGCPCADSYHQILTGPFDRLGS